jgi:hypothetical protein
MLGISSLFASLFFILGNWTMTWFLYERDWSGGFSLWR